MKPVPSPKLIPPQDLLLYDCTYRVVICTTCEYAIQPAAIARHLKEIHAIHRHHRRPYTDYTAGLDLCDPSKLLCDPFRGDFPVLGLPTISGLQCLSPGCGHLCATVKRMQSHWVSIHHASGCAALDWQSVPLQTFFKGNLLRYFTHPALSVLRPPEELEYTEKHIASIQNAWGRHHDLSHIDRHLIAHYVRSTCFTLANRHGNGHLWLTSVPQIATNNAFLCHGILALTALHLYREGDGSQSTFDRNQLIDTARAHYVQAMTAFQETIDEGPSTALDCHGIIAFIHLYTLHTFATISAGEIDTLFLADKSRPELDHLSAWLYYVRHGCHLVCGFWDTIGNGPLASLALSWDIPIMTGDGTAAEIAQHLMAAPRSFGSVPDICEQAARDLALALTAAFRMGDALTIWDAIRLWPLTLSLEFIGLVKEEAPAALMLLSTYCLILERLDRFWFANGLSSAIQSTIDARLEEEQRQALEALKTRISITLTSMDDLNS